MLKNNGHILGETLNLRNLHVFILLLVAAGLEALGDSFFQSGIHKSTGTLRTGFFLAGMAALALYGFMINTAPWDFGRLIGLYVVFFFVISQVIARLRFHQTPSPAMWVGGSFIVIGGAIIWLGQR